MCVCVSVEAAGGGGLQLFVDSNVPVDSTLIRQLVEEVLTEQIALMLGYRDAPEPQPGSVPRPGLEKEAPGAEQEVNQVRGENTMKMFRLTESAVSVSRINCYSWFLLQRPPLQSAQPHPVERLRP